MVQQRSAKDARRNDPPITACESVIVYKAYGTITDNAGNAMVNVAVRVHDTSETTNENDVITATDNTGHWEVICLENGNYTAVATKAGYTFDAESFTVSGVNTEVAINMASNQPDPGQFPIYIGDDDGFGFDLSNGYKDADGKAAAP